MLFSPGARNLALGLHASVFAEFGALLDAVASELTVAKDVSLPNTKAKVKRDDKK